jgi:hypothetical protein
VLQRQQLIIYIFLDIDVPLTKTIKIENILKLLKVIKILSNQWILIELILCFIILNLTNKSIIINRSIIYSSNYIL